MAQVVKMATGTMSHGVDRGVLHVPAFGIEEAGGVE